MASYRNGSLYVGGTGDLVQRVSQHRDAIAGGFTTAYEAKYLVWYEWHPNMESAILREKALKRWHRAWKLELIEKTNPEWRDLSPTPFGQEPGPPLAREYRWQQKRGPGQARVTLNWPRITRSRRNHHAPDRRRRHRRPPPDRPHHCPGWHFRSAGAGQP